MSNEMTEERLAEIQAAMREPDFPEVYRKYFQPVVIELEHVFADNRRLRAENERLTAALRLILASEISCEDDCVFLDGIGDMEHDPMCYTAIAYDALNPEATQ